MYILDVHDPLSNNYIICGMPLPKMTSICPSKHMHLPCHKGRCVAPPGDTRHNCPHDTRAHIHGGHMTALFRTHARIATCVRCMATLARSSAPHWHLCVPAQLDVYSCVWQEGNRLLLDCTTTGMAPMSSIVATRSRETSWQTSHGTATRG